MDLLAEEYDDVEANTTNATSSSSSSSSSSKSTSQTSPTKTTHPAIQLLRHHAPVSIAPAVHIPTTDGSGAASARFPSSLSSTATSSALVLHSSNNNNNNHLTTTTTSAEHARLPPSTTTSTTILGHVHVHAMDSASFSQQYHMYTAHGYAADPSGSGAMVGDYQKYMKDHHAAGGASATSSSTSTASHGAATSHGVKRGRLQNDDVESDDYLGPWAGYKGDEKARTTALANGNLTIQQKLIRVSQGLNPDGSGKLEGEELTAAKIRLTAELAKQTAKESAVSSSSSSSGAAVVVKGGGKASGGAVVVGAGGGGGSSSSSSSGGGGASSSSSSSSSSSTTSSSNANGGPGMTVEQASSTFHGKEEFDYQGRSWVEPPKGVRPDGGDHECFIPKRRIHTFTGHGKGVQSIQFFPNTGHLLLSGALDGKCKIWDVAGATTPARSVRRTYVGHTGGVRDARFDIKGDRFASASFDKHVMVWDTETGKATMSLSKGGGTPYSVAWNPLDPNSLLVASSNRKAIQYDVRSGEVALEYNEHLGPVNALMFFDNGKRFLSTSDDKKLLVWETGTPVPIKYIADPSLFAVPTIAQHPSGKYFVGQSMDNSLVPYICTAEKVGSLSKKTPLKGHISAGYACAPCFSTDGHFVVSGDGEGNVWVWDWNTSRILSKFKAHDEGPAIGTAWHPLEPSWLATCGWDGVIKLWD